MISSIQTLIALFSTTLFLSCSQNQNKTQIILDNGWKKEGQVLKSIKNIHFNFPDNGFAFDNKEYFVEECLNAMESDAKIIGLAPFTDTIHIRFLSSRDDMNKLAGMSATGMALPHIRTLFVVADTAEKVKPPIKHELMHLLAMLKWGYPHYTSTWINEGLAAYAEDNCNGYSVSEIYRYFLETDKLISIDSLVTDFYNQPEMIGYHQSAYVVEYLLENYSIKQFNRLWLEGFYEFESIYNMSFQEMKKLLEVDVIKKHSEVPNISWEVFKEGCMKSQPNNIPKNKSTDSELTPEQHSAFDALNRLQVSTDEKNRLYSTFAGIDQPCYPPDTSLTISQTELLTAMKHFVTSNCKNLTVEERDELAVASVLAQEEYTVLLCLDNSTPVTYENGVPMTGTWVMPNVLDQRDVIIVW